MTVATSYPGVYIQEFTPAPPIQGVGTSTAAFLGPTKIGPIDQPTLVTSFDQFKQLFGDAPVPGFYLWYAVQGFFIGKPLPIGQYGALVGRTGGDKMEPARKTG